MRWLESEGVFVRWQLANKLQGMLQDMSDHAADHPDVAAKWKKIRHLLPPPRAKRRVPVPVPLPPRKQPDAPPRAAPPDEGVRVDAPEPAPPTAPIPAPPPVMPGQPVALPPPDMQIRPVRWRPREAHDYDGEDVPGTNGHCITEYDPLRDEDDDEEP